MNSEAKREIEKEIGEIEGIIERIKDKRSYAYISGLHTLKVDYEKMEKREKAESLAREIQRIIIKEGIKYDREDLVMKKNIDDILVKSYDTLARGGDYESFCIAMEWNREIERQFYLPRKKILKKHGVIEALQELIDGKLDLLVLNMPPRVGKSTLGLFLQLLIGSLHPNGSILSAGHSARLVTSFYNEINNLIESDEYRYKEIFSNNKIETKSAEFNYIDLNEENRFHTFNYISIETGGTGSVEASELLYCDDLVKDVEQANNPERLEKIYHNYTSTIKDRKIMRKCKDGKYRPCPEIHINTPWSIYDVTSRVINNAEEYGDKERVKIISIPCFDEEGDSNFKYDYGKGFTKEYYEDMEIAEDEVIFSAKYMMNPIERKGILFNKNNVSFYEELPVEEPDRVVAYCDVSHGGDDYFSIPIGYVYGYEVYIVDVLFKNNFGGDDYIRPKVRDILMRYKVNRCGVERNNGGDFFSTLMKEDLMKKNYRCNITTHNAPTNKRKLDRILACQNEIKGIALGENTYRIYFKSLKSIKGNKEYTEAMRNLFGWNQSLNKQKRQHDDFPDSLAGLITNVLGKGTGGARVHKLDDYL